LYSQKAIEGFFETDVNKEIVAVKKEIQTHAPMSDIKQDISIKEKKEFVEKTLRYMEVLVEDNEMDVSKVDTFKQSYESMVADYDKKQGRYSVDKQLRPESHLDKVFADEINSYSHELDRYVTPDSYEQFEEPIEEEKYFLEKARIEESIVPNVPNVPNVPIIPLPQVILPSPTQLDQAVDIVAEKLNWQMYDNNWSEGVPSVASIADVKARAQAILAAGANEQIVEAGKHSNILQYMTVLIIYRAAIEARADNITNNNYKKYLRRARWVVDNVEQLNGIPEVDRIPVHSWVYQGVVGRGEMYTGGYTGGGTTITLGAIMYTMVNYILYIIIIMMLLYLCFNVFIHNKPCKRGIPPRVTSRFYNTGRTMLSGL